jgi:hypothetical protein
MKKKAQMVISSEVDLRIANFDKLAALRTPNI